jgi:dTDP-4-amino-4,6-dideoxygalactose transaminase
MRRQVASWYRDALRDACVCPGETPDTSHVYHLYVIRARGRDGLKAHLENVGITTLMHYPVPVHLQEAYKDLGYSAGDLPVTEATVKEILSLPMHPAVTKEGVHNVCTSIRDYLGKHGETQ